ncbi:hypothetical protein [Staphylococcus capitis]|uniref:hypothetical protein n=1 Tax=Staphylococcus capitis TaxID=29388 RepID=UPI003D059F3F
MPPPPSHAPTVGPPPPGAGLRAVGAGLLNLTGLGLGYALLGRYETSYRLFTSKYDETTISCSTETSYRSNSRKTSYSTYQLL